LDDTARAIARLQEEAKGDKAAEARKADAPAKSTKRIVPSTVNGMGQRKIGGAAPYTSTKRPKTGGV
jgi:hypothetical protein